MGYLLFGSDVRWRTKDCTKEDTVGQTTLEIRLVSAVICLVVYIYESFLKIRLNQVNKHLIVHKKKTAMLKKVKQIGTRSKASE